MTLTTLLGMFGVVLIGSIIPVLPTGAAVSAAAVLAGGTHWWEVPLVVGVGAAGAYLGDITSFAVLQRAGAPLAQRVGWLDRDDPDAALARLSDRIDRRKVPTLLVSRLVPGGRVPVLLAAAIGGLPWTHYVAAAGVAALLWSVTYTVIGLIGDALVPDPQVAIIAVVVAATLLTVVISAVRNRLSRA